MNTESTSIERKIEITAPVESVFLETAKWAKLLAIFGFIGIGLIVLMSFFVGTIFANFSSFEDYDQDVNPFGAINGVFLGLIHLIFVLIYYFPIKYLYNFSSKVKKAFQIKDQILFNEAITNLKSHYKYIGILMIIVFSLNVLFFFFTILVSVVGSVLI